MASNPQVPAALTADKISSILSTVSSVAVDVEKLIAAAGLGGHFNGAQVEQLTVLFTSLAQVAIQAVHDAMGKDITPASVLQLMPVATPLTPAS
ncbi:MAG TPA: hypothetical protein VN176_18915 [Verrucomicrobiae bacterium]|jgi:hypothetical protein|nr:hypothetical protein [Verrucomicrobiae bacterium]